MLFEKLYNKKEQGPQSEDVFFEIDTYLEKSPVIKQWENELPILIYHGISMHCDRYLVTHMKKLIEKINEHTGKNIYAECLRVGNNPKNEVYSSIFKNMHQ